MGSEPRAFVTPEFNPTDPVICHSLALRPSLWTVFWYRMQDLAQEWQWRQDDPACATVQEVINELEIATDNAVFSGCIMLGQVIELEVETPPAWLLRCDGATYNRVDYPALYSVINAALIIDADSFRVPDRVRRQALDGLAVGVQEGSETHTNTIAELVPHTHGEQDPGSVLIVPGVSIEYALADPGLPSQTGSTGDGETYSVLNPVEGSQFFIIARFPQMGD